MRENNKLTKTYIRIKYYQIKKERKMKIKVCTSDKCRKSGGEELYEDLKDFSKKLNKYIEKEDLDKKPLKVKKTSCQHNCKHGPNVSIKSKQIGEASIFKLEEKILKKYDIKKENIV